MSDTNETIADIIAEMRGFKRYSASDSSDCRYVAYWLYQTFADRLEAALKRERGDCARLREALVKIEKMAHCDLWNVYPKYRDKFNDKIGGIEREARAALAAPPRNCDVGTVEEQFARFRKFCKKDSMDSFESTAYCAYECPCGNNYDCKLAWAQMPYSEGGAK